MPQARTPQETPNIKAPPPGNDQGIPTPTGDITPDIYRQRRRKVMDEMQSGIAIIFAADAITTTKRQDLNFYYLTGLEYEHGAALVLAPEHPQYQEQLFLRTLEIEDNRWHGNRPGLGRAIELGTGIAQVLRTAHMPYALNQTILQSKSRDLVYLGDFATYNAPVSKELKLLRDIQSRILNSSIRDESEILPRLRSIHDKAEIAAMQKAIDATVEAHKAAMRAAKPGMNEADLLAVFEESIHKNNCRRFAYEPIIGSGPNNAVLHYTANNRTIQAGEVILCDVGAEYQMYAADLTRAFPVDGTFTQRQKDVHNVVQDMWQATVDMCKPGITWAELNDKSKQVVDKAGFSDQNYHSLGHFLGLDVHDVGLNHKPLEPGMVITIEPGIYIANEHIGIRTEDDILITETGCINMSADLPRSADEIEAFMAN